MPPLQPGDAGDRHGEDDHEGDDLGHVPPLPPEDRLWRHPSEVAAGRVASAPASTAPRRTRPWRTAALVLASGMAGATLAVSAVALLGGFDQRVVERQVAVRTAPAADGALASVEALTSQTAPSIAALLVHRGSERTRASAVALRSDGYLVTDGPSVAGADEIDVVVHGGRTGVARIVGVDDVTGIAVLHLGGELAPAVTSDAADPVAVGADAIAVGASPDGGWDVTVSSSVVSAVGRRLEGADGAVRHGMILLDAPFAPGTAGGALIDRDGVVVGIVGGTPARADGMSFGVATPIDLVRRVADQLIEYGRAQHVWLGLEGTDLEVDEAMALGLAGGALVAKVDDGGPAHRAGIQAGDVVLAIDDEATPTMSALIAALRRHVPGDVVTIRVHREGETRTLRVTLDEKR